MNTYKPYMQYIENNWYVIKIKIFGTEYWTGIDINSSQEEKDKLVKWVLDLLNNLSLLKLVWDWEYSTDNFTNQQTNYDKNKIS